MSSLKGKKLTEEHKKKISEGKKGKKRPDLVGKPGPMAGKTLTEETKEKMRLSHLGRVPSGYQRFWNRLSPEEKIEIYKRRGIAIRESWARLSEKAKNKRVRNSLVAVNMRPNRAETSLFLLLDSLLPGQYQYVGGGELVLGGKCPDFVCVGEKKKLVEFFGQYWHKGHSVERRKEHFRKFGYETLIIWDYEMEDNGLRKRILDFHAE